MGLRDALAHLAGGAAAPVFAVAGGGARDAVAALALSPSIQMVDSPAAASVLLVAGYLPSDLHAPLAAVHDAMPDPRCTVSWPLGNDHGSLPLSPSRVRIGPVDEPVQAVTRAYRALLSGAVATEPPIQPEVDPNPWRGVGPYGQGGSGMTGGTPYGRPMAELGPDRDGLRLDVLPLSIGPFFPRFPAGLTLNVVMAGDLVIEGRVTDSPFVGGEWSAPVGPFIRALTEPVPVAEIELARARQHLRWASDSLITQGLSAFAMRVRRLAVTLTPDRASTVQALSRRLRLVRVPQWSGAGVGRIAPDLLTGLALGPISRAAGVGEDARATDPAYAELGFEPIVARDGDAAARWDVRLAEAAQSLELAARARGQWTGGVGIVEGPRGRLGPDDSPFQRLQPLLPDLLVGLEWGDAVTALASLDLDPEEAGTVAARPSRAEAA